MLINIVLMTVSFYIMVRLSVSCNTIFKLFPRSLKQLRVIKLSLMEKLC